MDYKDLLGSKVSIARQSGMTGAKVCLWSICGGKRGPKRNTHSYSFIDLGDYFIHSDEQHR